MSELKTIRNKIIQYTICKVEHNKDLILYNTIRSLKKKQ